MPNRIMKLQIAISKIVVAAIATVPATFIAGTAHADFFGDTVRFVYYFPDSSTEFYNNGTSVVPAVFDLTPDANYLPGTFTATVNADQIVINLDPESPNTWTGPSQLPGVSFNGWVLTDITQNPGITGVTIGSQSNFALVASMISFTSDSITVNWLGLPFGTDGEPSTLTLDVAFAPPVPLPAALPLFAGGLGLLGWMARRRRKRAWVA
jgi:hypothetical protein